VKGLNHIMNYLRIETKQRSRRRSKSVDILRGEHRYVYNNNNNAVGGRSTAESGDL